MVGLCMCFLLGGLIGNGGLGCGFFPLCLSSYQSGFCDCLLSSHRSRFCCFVIWKRKVVAGPLFFFFFFFCVWWILVATVEVDAGSAMAKVAVTVVIGFCGDCFYISL